jgi:hypothetical protein
MIGVGVVAIVMGGLVLAQRRIAYWVESVNHAKDEQSFRNNIVEITRVAKAQPQFAEALQKNIEYNQRRVAYHAALKVKYERAMQRPWESVLPDPEPPPVPEFLKPGRDPAPGAVGQ